VVVLRTLLSAVAAVGLGIGLSRQEGLGMYFFPAAALAGVAAAGAACLLEPHLDRLWRPGRPGRRMVAMICGSLVYAAVIIFVQTIWGDGMKVGEEMTRSDWRLLLTYCAVGAVVFGFTVTVFLEPARRWGRCGGRSGQILLSTVSGLLGGAFLPVVIDFYLGKPGQGWEVLLGYLGACFGLLCVDPEPSSAKKRIGW